MKRILVFTDFSDCAQQASNTAIKMAKKFDCELFFVHYMNYVPSGWAEGTIAFRKSHPEAYSEYLRASRLLAELEEDSSTEGVPAKSQLIYDFSLSDIGSLVGEHGVDYIIMGSHGRSRFEEIMMGSNAQEVVRYAPIPTMVVKEQIDISKVQLVFISDFSEEVKDVFSRLVEFANLIHARINLLYINSTMEGDDIFQAKERMSSFESAAGEHLGETRVIEERSLAVGIENYCSPLEHVMIAMGTHGRQGLERLLLGSQTEKIVNRLKHPVMSLPI